MWQASGHLADETKTKQKFTLRAAVAGRASSSSSSAAHWMRRSISLLYRFCPLAPAGTQLRITTWLPCCKCMPNPRATVR